MTSYDIDISTNPIGTLLIFYVIITTLLLIAILITLICFCVISNKNQKALIQKKIEVSNRDLTETEKQILTKYQNLDDTGKTLINQTLQTLNTKPKE